MVAFAAVDDAGSPLCGGGGIVAHPHAGGALDGGIARGRIGQTAEPFNRAGGIHSGPGFGHGGDGFGAQGGIGQIVSPAGRFLWLEGGPSGHDLIHQPLGFGRGRLVGQPEGGFAGVGLRVGAQGGFDEEVAVGAMGDRGGMGEGGERVALGPLASDEADPLLAKGRGGLAQQPRQGGGRVAGSGPGPLGTYDGLEGGSLGRGGQ